MAHVSWVSHPIVATSRFYWRYHPRHPGRDVFYSPRTAPRWVTGHSCLLTHLPYLIQHLIQPQIQHAEFVHLSANCKGFMLNSKKNASTDLGHSSATRVSHFAIMLPYLCHASDQLLRKGESYLHIYAKLIVLVQVISYYARSSRYLVTSGSPLTVYICDTVTGIVCLSSL